MARGGGFQGQGGVGAGMSGMRIVGPDGRDQSHTPGGIPRSGRVLGLRVGVGGSGAGCWGREFASSCAV